MNTLAMNHSDTRDYNINFLTGIYYFWKSKYKQATHFFLKAVYETNPLEARSCVYLSYLGLSAVLMDRKNGIFHHCYHSLNASFPIEPEVQLNLACAELIKGDRQRAVEAMDKIDDLELLARSSEEIHSFFDIVGKREKDTDGSLKRNNPVHKSMGKMFRKKDRVDTGKIETLIRTIAKKHYKGAILSLKNRPL